MSKKSVKISNIEFTASEWDTVVKTASTSAGYQSDLTDQNKLRLALGLQTKKRGGARPNTGNRKPPLGTLSGVAKTGRRAGSKHKKP